MAKIIGIIEMEINEDETDTEKDLIEYAKEEFNYAVQDKEMYSGRLQWQIKEEF